MRFAGGACGLIDEALASVHRSCPVVLAVNQFFTTGSEVAQSDVRAQMPRHFVQSAGLAPQLAVHAMPFDAPPIQVDALWHQRPDADRAQPWQRAQVLALAQALPLAGPGGKA